ncbi:MAG: hypothetical protein AAF533_09240 [Acidobacteriota bacterium]
MTTLRVPLLSLLLLVTVLPTAHAQGRVRSVTYPVKFTCGFETGRVPLQDDVLPFNSRYKAVEPGDYATVVNMVNLGRPTAVRASVVVPGEPRVDFSVQPALGSFEADALSCEDLARETGRPADGAFFEGWVLLGTRHADVEVTAVYTHAIEDFFQQERLLLLQDGLVLEPGGPEPGPGVIDGITASASAGLGVGASIDVERIAPRVTPRRFLGDDLPVDDVP